MQDDFGLWDVLVSMFWFMFLIIWIWMLISILADIFRDRDLGGGAKALWTLFIIVIPWLGALVYIFARGSSMHERQAPAGGGPGGQHARLRPGRGRDEGQCRRRAQGLTELRDSGVLTPRSTPRRRPKCCPDAGLLVTTVRPVTRSSATSDLPSATAGPR